MKVIKIKRAIKDFEVHTIIHSRLDALVSTSSIWSRVISLDFMRLGKRSSTASMVYIYPLLPVQDWSPAWTPCGVSRPVCAKPQYWPHWQCCWAWYGRPSRGTPETPWRSSWGSPCWGTSCGMRWSSWWGFESTAFITIYLFIHATIYYRVWTELLKSQFIDNIYIEINYFRLVDMKI